MSCKDDDKDGGKSAELTEQEVQEQADKFWKVVGQLTSMDNYTADYQDKTFEPNIGEPSEDNPYVRIVATNDQASAAERFANLVDLAVGDGFPVATPSYEWKDDAVGTLTYRATDNGSSWAEVDVNIKQLPHLQKIIYRSPAQGGTNASFSGSAYYRFGDVIKKKNADDKWEYWICVRPAFGKEGKSESHWVTLSPLPQKNVEHITKYNQDYYVPKALGTNTEQMQNLIEMLYAMMYPKEWDGNLKQFSPPSFMYPTGLRMFHDFSHAEEKRQYHNPAFWQRVRDAWEANGLFKTIFGFNSDDQTFIDFFDPYYSNGRMHLLYNGYSWWSSVSGNLTLYECTYETGDGNGEKNMHLMTKREVKKDMRDLSFNINKIYTEDTPYIMYAPFFGDAEPRYIIRHATGADLMRKGTKWDYKQPINDAEPVYVYNYYYYPEGTKDAAPGTHFRDLTLEPEISVDHNDREYQNMDRYDGMPYFFPGDVIIDEDGSRWFCVLNGGGSLIQMPYSYFVTFDNIQTTQDNGNIVATNIVEEETLPRLLIPMIQVASNYIENPASASICKWIVQDVLANANFDLTKIIAIGDSTIVNDNNAEESRPASQVSIAYIPQEGITTKSRIMRFVMESISDTRTNRQWKYHLNTRYDNSNDLIRLADIADQNMVNQYAKGPWTGLKKHYSEERMPVRTLADPRATDISNYLWTDGRFVTDATSMWNEPVLVFRATKVYDRGAEVHGTKTFHGHHIVKVIPGSLHDPTKINQTAVPIYVLTEIWGALTNNLVTLDGKPYEFKNYTIDMY